MASVEINYALKRSHIPKKGFKANGTFADDGPGFVVTCKISKAGGHDFAGTVVADKTTGKWEATFGEIPTKGMDHFIRAHITGAAPDDDEQAEIVVDEIVVIDINELSPPPHNFPPDYKEKKVPYEVKGEYRAGTTILCVAFVTKKNEHSVVGEAVALLDKPKKGQWSAKFMIPLVPAGKKIAVMATAFNAEGEVLGRAFKRR